MDFLVPVSSKQIKPLPVEIAPKDAPKPNLQAARSLEEALQILREQPDTAVLINTLGYLTTNSRFKETAPVSAQIVHALVNTILPDFWCNLSEKQRLHLAECLRTLAGLGAILARLTALFSEQTQRRGNLTNNVVEIHVRETVQLLSLIVEKDDFVNIIWETNAKHVKNTPQQTVLWRELLGNVVSGKVISIVAQAEQTISVADQHQNWLSQGSNFALWLGRNIAVMAENTDIKNITKRTALAQLLGRSFSLGYSRSIIAELLKCLLIRPSEFVRALKMLLKDLRTHEKRQLFDNSLGSALELLHVNESQNYDNSDLKTSSVQLKALAGLVDCFIKHDEFLKSHLVNLLIQGRSLLDTSTTLRRASLAALSIYEDDIQAVLEKSMQTLGDPLFIKHAPMIQQEALAQVLLISAGYIHRKTPMQVFVLGRSSYHTHGVSNRLAASSPRARYLGMIVGLAISELIDKPENRMVFDIDELDTEEARWYRQLIQVNDRIGSVEDLKACLEQNTTSDTAKRTLPSRSELKSKAKAPSSQHPRKVAEEITGPRIIEVLDDEEDAATDFKPHAKPDSDPEDESEDPTLINRDKPKAPVYIRDLMAGLRDTENHDRYHLAVSNAAGLIRRKSSFGREVTDNWEELANLLTSLQDPYDFEDFEGMQQRALMAILLAQPNQTGPWFAKAFFDGDYSIHQRLGILTALGMGARHLAGFHDDVELGGLPQIADSFPSKRLPEKIHSLFVGSNSPVDSLAKRLEQSMIEPMALKAADEMTGPSVLKVRTFSSRIEKQKMRKKPISNELAKIVGESMFFPLTGRWWAHSQTRSPRSVLSQPHLLQSYLKTLALLLHASGPSTLSLPQMSSEFWDLLFSVRTSALSDVAVLEGVLFALLTLLEVNENKERLAQEHAKELLETQEWVKLVLDSRASGSGEDDRVRALAAGVGMRCSEVIEKYQRMLLGDLVNY